MHNWSQICLGISDDREKSLPKHMTSESWPLMQSTYCSDDNCSPYWKKSLIGTIFQKKGTYHSYDVDHQFSQGDHPGSYEVLYFRPHLQAPD